MNALKKLAVCYLVSVSAFALAAGLRAWPDAADRAARLFEEHVRRPAAEALARADRAFLDAPDVRAVVALEPASPPAGDSALARVELPRAEHPDVPLSPEVELTLDAPITIAPDLLSMPSLAPPPRAENRAAAPRPVPRLAVAPRAEPAPQADAAPPLDTGQALTPEQTRARARLAATLTPEMREHFGLFIFVSKAAKGPLAQRAYVFKKEQGALRLLYDWPASTGREQSEISPRGARSLTATPAGLYQFDPGRMYRQYRSYSWDQDMPHAMFFNWQREGVQTGLAIHAASGDDVARLGQRASAGCVHLAPENARTLFELVKGEYRGQVPRFAIDGNDTMSTRGKFSRRADGSLRMTDGYKVLVDIENYSGTGGSDAVALF